MALNRDIASCSSLLSAFWSTALAPRWETSSIHRTLKILWHGVFRRNLSKAARRSWCLLIVGTLIQADSTHHRDSAHIVSGMPRSAFRTEPRGNLPPIFNDNSTQVLVEPWGTRYGFDRYIKLGVSLPSESPGMFTVAGVMSNTCCQCGNSLLFTVPPNHLGSQVSLLTTRSGGVAHTECVQAAGDSANAIDLGLISWEPDTTRRSTVGLFDAFACSFSYAP